MGLPSTYNSMNMKLDMGIRTLNLASIVNLLKSFLEMKKQPKPSLLKKLSESRNLPDILVHYLSKFNYKAQNIKDLSELNRSRDLG